MVSSLQVSPIKPHMRISCRLYMPHLKESMLYKIKRNYKSQTHRTIQYSKRAVSVREMFYLMTLSTAKII
jgi:hypothetical protein